MMPKSDHFVIAFIAFVFMVFFIALSQVGVASAVATSMVCTMVAMMSNQMTILTDIVAEEPQTQE